MSADANPTIRAGASTRSGERLRVASGIFSGGIVIGSIVIGRKSNATLSTDHL